MVTILPGINIYGFVFDDFELRDNHSDFYLKDIDTSTQLTKRIKLRTPIVSAPMDTVTESNMAIALAQEGGLGIIHYNFRDMHRIIEELEKVKRYESGFIENPVTLSPGDPVDRAAEIRRTQGVSTIPVTDDGKPNGRLVGIITKDDYSMSMHAGRRVEERMTKDLITAKWSDLPDNETARLRFANRILLESHIGTLPIVDSNGHLMYLVTRADLEKNEQYPLATKDDKKRLRVGVAVSPKDEYWEIAQEAVRKGADVILPDTAKGNSAYNIQFIKRLRGLGDDFDIIGGSVSTEDGTERLIGAGADAIRVNAAYGKRCITRRVSGAGCPQGTAIYQSVAGAKGRVPIIADGAMEFSGDIGKALVLGASAVMTGNLLAGCYEAPGWDIDPKTGSRTKMYRGMGSAGAMAVRGSDRYSGSRTPEGVEKKKESTGSIHEWVPQLMSGVRRGMEIAGARTIPDLWNATIGPAREGGAEDKNGK